MDKIFSGFTTIGSTKKDNFKLYDEALVRQDLYNHFHTRIGERVLRPEYGCRIWDYLMEPFTDDVKRLCEEEVVRICESEPRVQLNETRVLSQGSAILVMVTLTYIPFNVMESFTLEFETRQAEEF